MELKPYWVSNITKSMKRSILLIFTLTQLIAVYPQQSTHNELKSQLSTSLTQLYKEIMLRPGRVSVDSIAVNERKKSIALYTNLSLSYLPMRENTVIQVYDSVPPQHFLRWERDLPLDSQFPQEQANRQAENHRT